MKNHLKQIIFGALGGAVAGLAGMAIKRMRDRSPAKREEEDAGGHRSRNSADGAPTRVPYPPRPTHFHGSPVTSPVAPGRRAVATAGYYHRGNR